MNELLSTAEVARLLGVAVKSIQTWIDRGKLPAGRTPGGHRRIQAGDLVDFLKRQMLPIPSALARRVQSEKTQISGKNAGQGKSARVLLIHRDPSVSQAIQAQLKQAKTTWEVAIANDSLFAGQCVEMFQPDVVLLDMQMPGLDGEDACRRIKRSKRDEAVRVIALDRRCSVTARKAMLACGAETLLSESMQGRALLAEIEKAMPPQAGGEIANTFRPGRSGGAHS